MPYCKSCSRNKGIKYFRKFKNGRYTKTCLSCLEKIRNRKSKRKKKVVAKTSTILKPKTIFFYFREHFRKLFTEQNKELSQIEIDKLVMKEWRHDQETDAELFDYFNKVAQKETLAYYKSLVTK